MAAVGPAGFRSQAGERLAVLTRLTAEAFKNFFRHGGLNLAASVAFFAILSLIPFFFIVVSLAGRVIGHSERIHQTIQTFLENAIPYYSEILMGEVAKISVGSGLHGVIGVVFMIWIGSLVFDSLDYALNAVFESHRNRSFIKTKLLSFAVFPASGIILILSLFLSTAFTALGRIPAEKYLPALTVVQRFVVEAGMTALPYLLLIGVLVLLYRIVPAVKVTYPQALAGAVVCTAGWAVAKWLFGLVIVPNPTYGVVYGSLTALIVLILWIYFAMCLVLLAAEFIAAYRRMKG